MISGSIEYWNGDVGRRWAASQQLLDAVLEPFGQALIDAAALPSKGLIVDVGCGCGATTLMAVRRSPKLEAIGVDVSRPMLAVAEKRAAAEASRVRFLEADAASSSIGDAPADRVISRFGVMFFENPPAAFLNMHGWLKPRGMLAMTVWGPMERNPWVTMLVELVRRHFDLKPPPPGSPGPFSLGDAGAVGVLLEGAGFINVRQTELGFPMRIPGNVDDVLAFCRDHGPVATALEEANDATRTALLDDLRAFVVQRHDGKAITLPARARLVLANRSP